MLSCSSPRFRGNTGCAYARFASGIIAFTSITPSAAEALYLTLAIPTFKRPELLASTLESLRRCSLPPDEVVVVDGDDGASALPVVERVRALDDLRLRYLRSEPGITTQRNVALDATTADVIVFSDDDVRFTPSTFNELRRVYASPDIVGATGRIIERSNRRVGDVRSLLRGVVLGGGREGTMTSFGYPRRIRQLEVPHDVEFMLGSFMSARFDVAKKLRFDEGLPGYGFVEDEDFSYRLSRLGRVRYDPRVRVEHLATGFRSSEARVFNRKLVISRAYAFRKNFRQSRSARAGFAAMVVVLAVHRTLNGELSGVLGLVDGAVTVWRRRLERLDLAVDLDRH